jgi:amino acid adenylation domain-containing protein
METGRWQRLSHGQEGLWFLWKLVPEASAYHNVLPLRIRGALDVDALHRALQRLVDRHPSMRMEFKEEAGRPCQRTRERQKAAFEVIDAFGWSETRLDGMLREYARRPFDLERDAAPRVTLFRAAPDHHLFLLVAHHIVSDLWSFIVLMDELREAYAAERAGREPALPALPLSYAAYVGERHQMAAADAAEALWKYWRDELPDDLPVLDLPIDHARPSMQSFRGGTVVRRLDAELMRKVKLLAGRERATVFMALMAAYQAFLHRYTGQESFVVGSPTAGRDRAELHGVVGDFINMVPVRADLTGRPSFKQLLARVRTKLIETIRHQDYPFSLIVDRLHLRRDLSRSPVFQTTLVLQKFHRYPELSRAILPDDDEPSIPFADLTLEPIPLSQQDGQFDLNLEMKEDDRGRLACAWKYASDLFERSTIERMASHFETLLEQIVVEPDRPVAELRLLSDAESEQVIAAGTAVPRALPDAASVAELFAMQVLRDPEAVAVSCGATSLTYRELDERVTSLARALVDLGVRRDVIVGVLLPRGLDFITAILAVSRAGGAFLPLDARHPAARTLQVLAGSGTPLVLTSDPLAEELQRGLGSTELSLRIVKVDELAQQNSRAELPAVSQSDLAYVMFTSGSTGAPKGVMVEHGGMINHVLAKLGDLSMTSNDSLAQNGPPTFDIVVWQCLAPLVNGGRVVVFPDDVAEDPAQLLAGMQRRGVTVLQLVPSMLRAVLDEVASRNAGPPPLPNLRWIVPTGEALPTELCRRWFTLYPDIPILNTYGSTECSDDQCHYVVRRLNAADDAVTIVSIGTPIANMTAHVLDGSLLPVPAGVIGELYIGGIGVGRGYLGNPERTTTSFVPDPFSTVPGARLYRTRDFARRRADGNLDFLGRTDNTIKLRGLRIEPGDIETALVQHPSVKQAAVVASQHPSGENVLIAYVVAENDAPAESQQLRRFLSERLPAAMVPSIFTIIDALPLTANGKLDARRLPAPRWDGSREEELVSPRTPTEERIAAIWSDVLAIDRVGVTHDFFAIGGDSIRSIQIVARCQRAGIHLRTSDLFQHPTVAALAALADANAAATAPAAIPQLQISDEHLALALAQVSFDSEFEP